MRVCVFVSCYELEEDYALAITLRSTLSRGYTVFIGYDRYVPEHHRQVIDDARKAYGGAVEVVVTNTVGIGNNRNVLAHRAIEAGCDLLVQSDCHVEFFTNVEPFNSVYKHAPLEDRYFRVGVIPQGTPIYYGTVHEYEDIRKARFVWKADELPFQGEPVFVVSAQDLRRVADLQCGYIYLLPGYSHEIADVMLTISRMGRWFTAVENILYSHRINKGDERRWRERWDPVQLEMFHTNLTIYEAKHGFPRRYYNERLAEKYKDRIECGIQCSNSLKHTTKEVYDTLYDKIKRGVIVA